MTEQNIGREVAVAKPRREVAVVQHPIPLYDTEKFAHMQRICALMAEATLIPEHLKVYRHRDSGLPVKENDPAAVFDAKGTLGNCLMVVNQAEHWRMDPFLLAQETFRTPNGQMGYGGKAVAAALESVHGIKLDWEFFGEEGSDGRGIRIWGPRPGDGAVKELTGTVGKWKTKNRDGTVKTNWLNQPDDQLIYRGTRQWSRRHASGVIMGIVTEDEIDEMIEHQRALRAIPVASVAQRISGEHSGFSREHVRAELSGSGAGAAQPNDGGSDEVARNDVQTDHRSIGEATAVAGETPATDASKDNAGESDAAASGTAAEQPAEDADRPSETAPVDSSAEAATPDPGEQAGQEETKPAAASSDTTSEPADADTSAPAPRPTMRTEYANRLNVAKTEEGLSGAHREFRKIRVWPDDPGQQRVLQAIYDTVLKRIRGEITPKACRDTLIEMTR